MSIYEQKFMNLFYSTSFSIATNILKNIYENFSSKKEGLRQPFVEHKNMIFFLCFSILIIEI